MSVESISISSKTVEVPEEPSTIVSAFACVTGKRGGATGTLAKMWNTRIELFQEATQQESSFSVTFEGSNGAVTQPLKSYLHSNNNGFIISSIKLDSNGNVPSTIEANDKFTNALTSSQTVFSGPSSEGIESLCLKFDVDRGSSMVFESARSVFVKFTCTKRSGNPSAVNTQYVRWGLLTMQDATALGDVVFTWVDMTANGSQLSFS